MKCWEEDGGRWEREEAGMRLWFPNSRWSEIADGGRARRRWQVAVTPTPPADELAFVIADLDRDAPVIIEAGGRIRHHGRCRAPHILRPALENLSLAEATYNVDLVYREPPGHPIVRCVEPALSKATQPDHPHFYGNDAGDHICPLFPPDGTWQWRRNTAADYLQHVALWLVKTAVWSTVRQATGAGIWLGSEAGHSLDELARVDPASQCPCGSGRKYRQCCLQRHAAIRARIGGHESTRRMALLRHASNRSLLAPPPPAAFDATLTDKRSPFNFECEKPTLKTR